MSGYPAKTRSPEVDALLFDVFGTMVDWRGGVIRDGERLGREKGLEVDWAAFADAWRGEYRPSMQRVRDGEIPWTNLDALHRDSLEGLLVRFGITGLNGEDKDSLNRVWHRLDPWPDSVPVLARLRRNHVIAPLSNGNVALLTNMAKRAGLPWDLILSAELARHYKPDREAYLKSVELLGLLPEKVMMVAAHPDDLDAAAEAGLRTAYVHRPLEFGPGKEPEPPEPTFDYLATDLEDLAGQLGA